ncbi:rab9 effector protein with kelch motifs-like isoform X1 [Scleropages formosus]|uniref:rab9 effector protein with kelch motifs-like isoform X1 n=2 Tax=Scleropages formosus TaxID=113540 RepID=UPI000877F6BD|nr:rab9 effector protein with kelch motifs isoform X1 [Scleropages formosus]
MSNHKNVSAVQRMELLPVLEPEDKPQKGIWYALVPRGGAPGVNVGHTCTYVPSSDGDKGKIVIVGGANPSGSFADCHVIDLDRHEWDEPEWPGLLARYEHCSFVPESSPQNLWVFAGAEKSGNRNCVQTLDVTGGPIWRSVQVKGKPPSPRTYHTNSACVGERLFVFSGGDAGATPVPDPQIHVFDAVSSTWSQPEFHGKPPSARHGHVVVVSGSKLYVHGGLAGDKFHSDMFCLDTVTMTWERIRAKGDVPPGMAAHSALASGKNIYIFGGMTAEGAVNSMYRFQTDQQCWTLVKFEGDLPPNRLDHCMCLVPWRTRAESEEGSQSHAAEPGTVNLCFVFGGMDTQGVIHNDCVVTLLT